MSVCQPETDRVTRGWALALTSVGFFMGALDALV